MAVSLRRQPVEKAGWEARAKHTDGMCQHSSTQQTGKQLPVDASVDLQQGVAFTVVLRQERHSCSLARVYRAPHRRGPRLVEEVGGADPFVS